MIFFIIFVFCAFGFAKAQVEPWWALPGFYLNTPGPATTLLLALRHAIENDPGMPPNYDYTTRTAACLGVAYYGPILLNQDERGAIACYTVATGALIYPRVNYVLRERNTNLLRAWTPYLKLFHTAVQKLQPLAGTYYRGISLHAYGLHQIGSIVTVDLSWTSDITTANMFSGITILADGQSNHNCTLAVLSATSARYIEAYSMIRDENEFIMLPGTLARIVYIGRETPTTCRTVVLEEIDRSKVLNTTKVDNLLNDILNSNQIQEYNRFIRDYYNTSFTVRIFKNERLNIVIFGGSDNPYSRWPYIAKIINSAATTSSSLNVGQILVAVNGQSTRGMSEENVRKLIQNAIIDKQKYTDYTIAYR